MQVIGRVGPAFKDSEDRLVQNGNRTFEDVSPWPEYVRAGINRPVTPAIHKGWAPMMEKIKDAINEERRTSDTPYCCVDSIKCKENAMPGRTLTTWWLTRWSESGPRVDRGGHQSGKKETPPMTITIFFFKKNSLRKENKRSRREHSIVPRVLPVAPVPWGAGTYVPQNARANFYAKKPLQMQTGWGSRRRR